jgi:hypothetical protein
MRISAWISFFLRRIGSKKVSTYYHDAGETREPCTPSTDLCQTYWVFVSVLDFDCYNFDCMGSFRIFTGLRQELGEIWVYWRSRSIPLICWPRYVPAMARSVATLTSAIHRAFPCNFPLMSPAPTGTQIPSLLFAGYQMMFAVIAPALITGAFADRVLFPPYLIFIV